MTIDDDPPTNAAIAWLMRQQDPHFDEWDAFTEWLESDAENAAVYDQLASVDAALADRLLSFGVVAVQPDPPRPQRGATTKWARAWLVGGAAALAASLMFLFGPVALQTRSDLYTVVTPPGVRNVVVLEGGTRVDINGGTTLRFDRENPRIAYLDTGEANFNIRHDPSRPFRVRVRKAELVDLGTQFNVVADDDSIDLAVAEGSVAFHSGDLVMTVAAGEQLLQNKASAKRTAVDPNSVGAWRDGRLIYRNSTLATVVRDLSRNTGKRFVVDPEAAERRITAIIQLPANPDDVVPQVEALLGVSITRSNGEWIVTTDR